MPDSDCTTTRTRGQSSERCKPVTYQFERSINLGDVQVRIREAGEGPLVLLLHGFPELAYSWRHQVEALADAGFHAVAFDQRGYGRSSRPRSVSAYAVTELAGDVVALARHLGADSFAVVGHDWGAPVAWHTALLRPDVIRAVALLSVPYLPRLAGPRSPVQRLTEAAQPDTFYQVYFQDRGLAEAELMADIPDRLARIFVNNSGDAPPGHRWRPIISQNETFFDTLGPRPTRLPDWFTEKDLETYTRAFAHSGFYGPLNWYRNLDRNWRRTAFLTGARVRQPSLFIAGSLDPITSYYQRWVDALPTTMPGLTDSIQLAGAGHWIQQERPDEVNRLLVEFLSPHLRR